MQELHILPIIALNFKAVHGVMVRLASRDQSNWLDTPGKMSDFDTQ